ncbi:proline dehydrogenase family protein [Streptomyces stelliscabiei]|uniref:proline dehydrogenase family protein n=1 Tax=Streptomyces stelliscabiei TaxID=146820 RepID=UPI0029AB681B|nr:proline dehydrogenase family protein [Streptomyces stelliscabiei]MDX3435654.1 proline dehydrogenase family protein [Streptomyces stelliscabiei]MDX3622047.1 proline dehydrogenase family protein [Streptomyces stelliscabiei]
MSTSTQHLRPISGHPSAPSAVLSSQAAQVLRTLALDEELKWRIPQDAVLGPVVRRVARRYVAGEGLADALDRAQRVLADGHRVNVEYMGESCRDRERAGSETDVFLKASRLLPTGCSISLDLSHIGLAVDEELALANATRIARATAERGREMVISAEGSDRTDAVLAVHRALCEHFDHVGITVQARLHRTAGDLPRLLELPGRIRLVKGAFLEPETVAYAREDPALATTYLTYAEQLADSSHLCSFATHDWDLIHRIDHALGGKGHEAAPWEFETLLGLGPDRLEAMAERGHPTREYIVFGTEWWLYVCNRIAEDPQRLLQALVDAAS